MQSNPKSSSLGGIIAILGLVALIAGLVLALVLTEIGIGAWAIVGVGAILLILALILEFRRFKRAVTGHRGRFSFGNTIMAIFFTGIIIVVNIISIAKYHRFDTSSLEQFTLTPQTIKVIEDLREPVKLTAFFVPEEKDYLEIIPYLKNLIAEYEIHNKRLSCQFVDPDQHPDQANLFGITEYQTIVFESGNRRRLVPPSMYVTTDSDNNVTNIQAEHAFTSALLEVTGVAQKRVYFLTGHGEGDINTNFSEAKTGLLNDLYMVDSLNLMTAGAIPDDCAVLVIVAPQNELTAEEYLTIEAYLITGGQVLILTNPGGNTDVESLIHPWGVDVGEGTIVDPSSSMAPEQDIPVVSYNRNYFYLPSVYFPGAVAIVQQANVSSSIVIQPMLITTASAWQDKNFTADSDPVFDSSNEKMESLNIGVLVAVPLDTSATNYSRLAIIGDSDFASNENYSNANNGDLFLNTVNWLADETSLISIHRNVNPFRRLVVTQGQKNFILYSSMLMLPAIMLVVAGVIWWRRR
jgi:ABC-type uncharacterized transport system involved in gliding motility auxiliary subunit